MRITKISHLIGAALISVSALSISAQETSSFNEARQSEINDNRQLEGAGENTYISKETFDGIIAFQNQIDLAVFTLNNQPEVLLAYTDYITTYAEDYISADDFIQTRDAKLYDTIKQSFEQSEHNELSFSDYFLKEILLNKLNSLYESKVGLPRDKYFKKMVIDNYPDIFRSYEENIPIKDITDFFATYLPENQEELASAFRYNGTGSSTGGAGGGGPRGTCGCEVKFTDQSDPAIAEHAHNRYNRHAGSPNQSFRERWVDKAPLYQRNQWNAKSWSNPQEVDKNTSLVSTSSKISVTIECNDCSSNEGCFADVDYIGSIGTNLAVDTNVTGIFGTGVSESLSTSNSTFEVRTATGNHGTMLFDKELTLMKSHSRKFNMKGITDFVAAVGNAAKTIKVDKNGNINDQTNLSEVVSKLVTTGKTIMTNEERGQAGASQHMKVEVDSTDLQGFSSNNLRNGQDMIFETKTNSHIKLKEADGASYHTNNTTGGVLGVAVSGIQCTSGVINKPVKSACWLKGAGFDTPYSLATLEQKIDGFIGRSLGISNFDSTQYSNGCY